jgi:adenylate cyclase
VVYDQLKRKVEVGFQFLGEHHVKNIAEPVRIYRVLTNAPAGSTIDVVRRRIPALQRRSLAAGVFLFALATGAALWLRPFEPRIEAASVERWYSLCRTGRPSRCCRSPT